MKESFKIEKQLGQGSFATVHLARDGVTGRLVAIKRAKDGVRGAARLLRHEARVLKHLSPRCALVPRFLGITDDDGLVSDALLGGSLSDLKRRPDGWPIPRPEASRLARGMLRALQAVHEVGVVHRDVKPSNFVLDEARQTVHLIDFGGALVMEKPPRDGGRHFYGTSMYASLRAHDKLKHGPTDDMWSMAFVVIDMVTGSLPWKEHVVEQRRLKLPPRKGAKEIKQQCLADIDTFPGLDGYPALRRLLSYLAGLGAENPDYVELDNLLSSLETPPRERSVAPVRKRDRRLAFATPGTDYYKERLRSDVAHRRVRIGKKRACVRCGCFQRNAGGHKKRRGGVSSVTCSYCPGPVHLCDTEYRPCFRLFHEEERLGGQEQVQA